MVYYIVVGLFIFVFGVTPAVMIPASLWFGRHEKPTAEPHCVVPDSERYPCDGSLGMNHPCI